MTRLLVTGGTGFVGAPAVRAALARGHEVHVLARDVARAPAGAQGHAADLLAEDIASIVRTIRPTHLLHLAWITTPGEYWASPENDAWVEASIALLEAFSDVGGERALLAGSCAEYDWTDAAVLDETHALRPATPYGAAKADLHRRAAALAAERGLALAWARLFFLYGPGEHPGRLIPYVVRRLLARKPALCTSGTQRRDFLHVDDVADALATVLEGELTGPVNIAGGKAIAVKDLIHMVARAVGAPDLVRLGARPTPAGEPPVLTGGVARIQGELGWHPRVSPETGVAKTVDWWREHL